MVISKIDFNLADIASFSSDAVSGNQIAIRWLGQAGFEIFYKGCHLMIDPYLSDYLAKKYAGKEFPHKRMMPVPVDPAKVEYLDYVLCTHRHSDHMDPETVPMLLKNNSKCKLIAPKAEKEHVTVNLGINEDRTIFVNADESVVLNDHIRLEVIPSAHEELKRDQNGNHHYLGYILRFDDVALYHSGDGVPYVSLPNELKNRGIDIALLPVNGRDEFRTSKGVLGNFSFEESLELCKYAEIPVMICHHFGMFDFNTVDTSLLIGKAKAATDEHFECIVPSTDLVYQIVF